jgi:hypothetical protein
VRDVPGRGCVFTVDLPKQHIAASGSDAAARNDTVDP